MFDVGTLIYFTPFYFKNKNAPVPKFFIVLYRDNNNGVLACLPSSKNYIPSFCDSKSGCIEKPY